MKQIPLSAATKWLEKVPDFFGKWKLINTLQDPVTGSHHDQTKTIQTTSYFFGINFNIILPPMLRSTQCYHFYEILYNTLVFYSNDC